MHKNSITKIYAALILLIITNSCCQNSLEPPNNENNFIVELSIINPTDLDRLDTPVIIQVEVSDIDRIESITYKIDNEIISIENTKSLECYWNVLFWADDKYHTISTEALDLESNIWYSDTIKVFVSSSAHMLPIPSSPPPNYIFANSIQ